MSHPQFRKIFWNIKDSFMGVKFLKTAPGYLLIFPVAAGIPLYTLSIVQTSNVYYDEYDGDVVEGKFNVKA